MSADFLRGRTPPPPPGDGSPPSSPVSILSPRLIIGLAVVLFGALLLLDNLNYLEASPILRVLFPCVLLAIGAAVLSQKSRSGWIWIAAGGWLLLNALEIIDLDFWQLFFPLALVLVGGNLVFRAFAGPHRKLAEPADPDAVTHVVAVMSGNERRNSSQEFRGGDLVAFMGGATLDLRQAKLVPGGAVVDVFAVWGGIELRVPENWRVESDVLPLMGGFEDNTKPLADPAAIEGRLLIRGVAIMGGIAVKN